MMQVPVKKQVQVNDFLRHCLPEFSHINHYWDKQKELLVAKILPGEFYVAKAPVIIATTLGSCISACIWDDKSRIGGMNHFMLPLTNKEAHKVDWANRGIASDATRYGNFAMEHLINVILRNGGQRKNLRAKIFGGSKVLNHMSNIGDKNISFVLHYLKTEQIAIQSSDLGSIYPRKVIFDPMTGTAYVKKLNNIHNNTIVRRETNYKASLGNGAIEGEVELF